MVISYCFPNIARQVCTRSRQVQEVVSLPSSLLHQAGEEWGWDICVTFFIEDVAIS